MEERAIRLHPTAGYIQSMGADANPEPLTATERGYLRELAKGVFEGAEADCLAKERLWAAHNDLADKTPLFVVYPEDGWYDLVPPERLRAAAPFWRNVEWYLLSLAYRKQLIRDDFVIKPELYYEEDVAITGWGCAPDVRKDASSGGYSWKGGLKSYDSIAGMLQFPEAVFNDAATALRGEALASVFGDICAVKRSGPGLPAINQPGIAAFIRGLEQLLLDMYDEPEGLHALLRFITDGLLSLLRQLENSGRLTLNNKNHYVDSGGNGYTGKLPAGGYNGAARLKDLWGFGLAQEYSDVSPDMHAEFGFRYQAEAMALFGANAYGCCEPLTYKFEAAKKLLPNLRRVSVSPWCDARRAAEALGEQYILSLKPNPAIVLLSDDLETVRGHVRALLEATKGCYAEVFLKDCMRLKGKEQRLVDFVNITRQEIGRL